MWDSNMTPSIILYLVIMMGYLLFLHIHSSIKNVTAQKCWFLITVLYLTVFAVLRKVDVTGLGGTDAITYVTDFRNMVHRLSYYIDWDKIKTLTQREPIYYLLTWLIRRWTSNYKVYFFVVYFIISFGITYAAVSFYQGKLKISKMPVMLLFVCYLHSFNVMRNWIAISICMIGLVNLQKGKDKNFIIALLIGVGFHYSTAILGLFYIFYRFFKSNWMLEKIRNARQKNRIYKRILFILIPVTNVALYIYSNVIMTYFAETKYRTYMEMQISWIGYLPVIIFALAAIGFYTELISLDKKNKIAVIGTVVNASLFYVYINMGGYRLNDCFIFFRIMLLIQLERVFIEVYHNRILSFCVNLCIILYFIQQLNVILTQSGILPYVVGM